MPNYEYQCTACEHIFEIWQPVGEAAPACPECGSAVKKIFHPPRVIFKGSGFYVTDLRAEKAASGGNSSSTSSSSSAKKSGNAANSATSSSESSSDSAPAKTDAAPADSATPAPSTPAKDTPPTK